MDASGVNADIKFVPTADGSHGAAEGQGKKLTLGLQPYTRTVTCPMDSN